MQRNILYSKFELVQILSATETLKKALKLQEIKSQTTRTTQSFREIRTQIRYYYRLKRNKKNTT